MDTHYASVMLATAESTQDEAATRFTGEPLLVVADRQTKGRGRFDREWVEPDRALFASLAFAPSWPPADWGLITLVAAMAMRDAIGEAVSVEIGLRWPNDLMKGDDKVGGILVEASGDRVVVGCGVNLWWREPIEAAAGVLAADPGPETAADLAARWTTRFLERMAAEPALWGRHEYEAACTTVGREVAYERGAGTAVGVDDDGSLLVETPDGVIAVHSGEIRVATLPAPKEEPA